MQKGIQKGEKMEKTISNKMHENFFYVAITYKHFAKKKTRMKKVCLPEKYCDTAVIPPIDKKKNRWTKTKRVP